MLKQIFGAAVAALTVAALAGCSVDATPAPTQPTDGPNYLRVLGGSELKDMAPILAAAEKATGVHVALTYTGTLDGTQEVADGAAKGHYDATWFPSDRYLALLPGGTAAVKHEEKIMYSPVVLGLKPAVAARLGWDRKSPTWAQIVAAVAAGQLHYGMTSPVSSNSGFSTLIEAATALSGTGNALQPADITKVTPQLQTFFEGQTLTSGSSGWLADKFQQSSNQADGIFNYESVLDTITLNGQHLVDIAPSDGVITADYPLALLASASGQKTALYNKLVAYLLRDSTQQAINTVTHRGSRTSTASGVKAFELPFPNQLTTVKSLLGTYLAKIKKPSDIVFTIDTSGSMDGARLDSLKRALTYTTNTGGTDSFTAYQNRETVDYVNFADTIKSQTMFTVGNDTRTADLAKIQAYIAGLNADGGTAIYSAMEASYAQALRFKAANPGNFVSVVLFTDGENNTGASLADFKAFYAARRASDPAVATIPAYVVLFGEGNASDLTQVASLTGGKLFDAENSDLTSVFKEIRGYQ